MKKAKAFLFILLLLTSILKAQFSDNFNDGDFTSNPQWNGDTGRFVVNSSNELRLLAPSQTDTSVLYTKSSSINNAAWEFKLKLDFNPSSANYACVYLVADQADLKGNINGYFVKVGNTADEVSLYRQDGMQQTEIIDGTDDRVDESTVNVKVRVTRDSTGFWQLFSDTSVAGGNFISEGSITDISYISGAYSGVFCRYSSTRSDKFYFDDFIVTGSPFKDTIAPEIAGYKLLSPQLLSLSFNEPLNSASANDSSNYLIVNSLVSIDSVQQDTVTLREVKLSLNKPLQQLKDYQLKVKAVQDTAGNAMKTDTLKLKYYTPAVPFFNALVINEFLYDPSPAVQLPDAEFVELYNRTDSVYVLKGWELSDGSSKTLLDSLALFPGEYLVLCPESDTSQYASFGQTLGLNPWPSLNNSGDSLILYDGNGSYVDRLKFEPDWIENSEKKDGGWSLEKKNPHQRCPGNGNWRASVDGKGGTPGQVNSVFISGNDGTPPVLQKIISRSPDTLELQFNETLEKLDIKETEFHIDRGLEVNKVFLSRKQAILLHLNEEPVKSRLYHIEVLGLRDCSGTLIGNENKGEFVFPESAEAGDIIINEVLFNPRTGGADFVEIYNNSGKYIDLRGWSLADFYQKDDTMGMLREISSVQYIFHPGHYLLLTDDGTNISMEYLFSNTERFLEMKSFPTYNNDEDRVYLFNALKEKIDEFHYYEDMHFSLLNDPEGVSLERISFDRPTHHKGNWHSASESEGFATPGYENSQHHEGNKQDQFHVEPEVFSPDNDGFEDVLHINYQFNQPGFSGSLFIYDMEGREVRRIANNQLLGIEGTFTWDGLTGMGDKAAIGMYVVYFEVFNLKGEVMQFKEVAVLGGHLGK